VSSNLVEALRQTRAKYERLTSFHKALVELYEEAIAKVDGLAQESEQASSEATTDGVSAAIRRRSRSLDPRP
jgi:hypothetical protein